MLAAASRLSVRLERSWIEILFLFAPLVIVPLGLHLSMRLDGPGTESGAEKAAFTLQLPAALATVISFYSTSQFVSAGFAIPWIMFATALAAARIWRVLRTRARSFDELCALLAFLYLAIGAAWFLASRLGWHPMDFREPIVLLTAVHFHYAGFAAAVLVRAIGHTSMPRAVRMLLFPLAAAGALGGPAFLAAGFVIGPRIKLFAAILVVIGEIALGACFVASIHNIAGVAPRTLLAVSAASVAVAMCFAALWAIGEFPRQPFLDIARMAAWHGSLNAFGFTFCGLAGCSLWNRNARSPHGRSL